MNYNEESKTFTIGYEEMKRLLTEFGRKYYDDISPAYEINAKHYLHHFLTPVKEDQPKQEVKDAHDFLRQDKYWELWENQHESWVDSIIDLMNDFAKQFKPSQTV